MALILVVVLIWYAFAPVQPKTDYTHISDKSVSGKTVQTFSGDLPLANNQKEGETFSYSMWILVNDYTFNYGMKRPILTKGDCPGIYLDPTSNSIHVYVMDVNNTPESVALIQNMPAKKWIHLGIVVNQDAVDTYINGILYQHHTLAMLPKQNTTAVSMGSNDLGWDGVLSKVLYVNRSMSASEMGQLATDIPTDDLTIKPSGPQYYDLSWYTDRLKSQ